MKFMVIVNGHSTGSYEKVANKMVAVESTSCGGAEHILLDNFMYAETALAFDPVKESEAYEWAYETCEIISKDEYAKLENWITAQAMARHNNELREMDKIDEEIRDLEGQIALFQAQIAAAKEGKDILRKEHYEHDREHQLREGVFTPEQINELMN